MMTSVSGDRGIGKTYHLADELYNRYRAGFLCISNFKHVYSHLDMSQEDPYVLLELIRELGEFKAKGYELCDLLPSFTHTGVFMAIDEAHLFFGSDQFRRYSTDENFQFVIQFLAQARKQDVEIWYSTQDPSKIDINWRRYTEEWIRFRPVINWRKKILVKHPTRPLFRREMRHRIPFVWQEWHDIDFERPRFNYSMIKDDSGASFWAKDSTVIRRRLRRSGWMNPFPYKLYDSYQLIGKPPRVQNEFKNLAKVAYIPHTMKYESLPTIKKLLHMRSKDAEPPKRFQFKDWSLPEIIEQPHHKLLNQPVEFVDHLKFFNESVKKGLLPSRV